MHIWRQTEVHSAPSAMGYMNSETVKNTLTDLETMLSQCVAHGAGTASDRDARKGGARRRRRRSKS